MFSVDQEMAMKEALRCHDNTEQDNCPACGDPVRECAGHSQWNDPGYGIIKAHNADDHSMCYYTI